MVIDVPPRAGWKDWLPAGSLVAVLTGALLTGGGYIRQIDDSTRRIDAIEAKLQRTDDLADSRRKESDDLLRQIEARTARIEGKLESIRGAGS